MLLLDVRFFVLSILEYLLILLHIAYFVSFYLLLNIQLRNFLSPTDINNLLYNF
jgi:hypothetical protein